jgi:thiol-disulfide isomerase/thioredoxin
MLTELGQLYANEDWPLIQRLLVADACLNGPLPLAPRVFPDVLSLVPDVGFLRMDGSPLRLLDVSAPFTVLNFWASWCGPCIEKYPGLVRLSKQYPGRVVVLNVAVWEDTAQAGAWFAGHDTGNVVNVFDQEDAARQVFGFRFIPQTFILDRQHRVLPACDDCGYPLADLRDFEALLSSDHEGEL